jgi:hypothetical protein
MKNKSVALFMVMILAAAITVMAQPGVRGPGAGKRLHDRGLFAGQDFLPARLLLRAKDELGLNAEQVKTIGALLDTHQQWAIKFGAEMRIKGLKLRTAASEAALAEAEKLIREQSDMRAEMQIARLRLHKEIQALLTPEQKSRIAELKKDFRGRARDGMRERGARRQFRRN